MVLFSATYFVYLTVLGLSCVLQDLLAPGPRGALGLSSYGTQA